MAQFKSRAQPETEKSLQPRARKMPLLSCGRVPKTRSVLGIAFGWRKDCTTTTKIVGSPPPGCSLLRRLSSEAASSFSVGRPMCEWGIWCVRSTVCHRCVYISLSVHTYVCIYFLMYVCWQVYVCVCTCVNVRVCTCVNLYVYMYICLLSHYVCMHVGGWVGR